MGLGEINNNAIIKKGSVSWGASATAGTTQTVTISIPNSFNATARGTVITVYNGSAATSVTVSLQNVHVPVSTTRYAEVDRAGVGIGLCRDLVSAGFLMGNSAQIVFSNDLTGDAGGFPVEYEVRYW